MRCLKGGRKEPTCNVHTHNEWQFTWHFNCHISDFISFLFLDKFLETRHESCPLDIVHEWNIKIMPKSYERQKQKLLTFYNCQDFRRESNCQNIQLNSIQMHHWEHFCVLQNAIKYNIPNIFTSKSYKFSMLKYIWHLQIVNLKTKHNSPKC